jgi:hypothetical protein
MGMMKIEQKKPIIKAANIIITLLAGKNPKINNITDIFIALSNFLRHYFKNHWSYQEKLWAKSRSQMIGSLQYNDYESHSSFKSYHRWNFLV